jgi:hypothetical protein
VTVLVAMTTLGTVLLVWAGVLAVLVTALALATRHRRTGAEGRDRQEHRGATGDRRQGQRDRRVGLPDMRTARVERRSGIVDRRAGLPDRRRAMA